MTKLAHRLKEAFADPRRAAHHAGLRYSSHQASGIHRVPAGKGFSYRTERGRAVRDPETLIRIRSLAIPPAWRDVWICPSADGHIQAVGYDQRGRKQYRYHPHWRAHRDLAKYSHVIEFATKLPEIRRLTARHLRDPGLTRRKVLAATVRVMEKTLLRVGSEQYARENKTFGLATLRDHHAKVSGAKVVFDFRAKHGIRRRVDFSDKRLADVIRACRDLPGEELFQYHDDDGNVRDVKSNDVNDYLKEITGEPFTAKDFRTWAGTVLAAKALAQMELANSERQTKRNIVRAIEETALKLGNTTAVCRKCYVHPAVLDSYIDGTLARHLRRTITRKLARNLHSLSDEETAVLRLLRHTLKHPRTLKPAA